MAIIMEQETEKGSYEIVAELFSEGSLWTVAELARKTKFSKATVRNAIKVLTLSQKIEQVGYKRREGYVYSPVASAELTLRIGSQFFTLENLLSSIESWESPTTLLTDEKWSRLKFLVLQTVFKDNLEINSDSLRDYLDDLSDGVLELYRIVSGLSSVELWTPEVRSKLSSTIASSPVAMNTYADLKERLAS